MSTALASAAASVSTSSASSGAMRVGDRGQHRRPRRAEHPGPQPPVERDQVDPVPGPAGQRGEQQDRVHRGVQPGMPADPARRGPAGVQHDQDPPVPLRPPGADHHVAAAGGGPPVDGPDVVADHVLAQRVELAALARAAATGAARRAGAAGPASRGRCRRLRNGGSTRTVHGTGCRRCRAASPSGPTERTMTTADVLSPRRSGVRVLVTEACPPAGTRSAARPGTACALGCQAARAVAAQRPPARVAHRERDGRRLAEQHPGVAGPGDPQPPQAGAPAPGRRRWPRPAAGSPPAAQPRYGTPGPAARRSARQCGPPGQGHGRVTGAPARRRAPPPARRPAWRLRVPPRAAAGPGAAGSAGPAPSRRPG